MSEGSAKGFWMSAALHGGVAVAFFVFGFVLKSHETEPPVVFELVAGEGDNYMAKEAPALGTPGGVKIDIPAEPEPAPSPPASTPRETPTITPPPTKQPPAMDFKKQLQQDVRKANAQAKREIARERAAEKKRLEQEKRRLEEEKKRQQDDDKRLTKEEFDRKYKGKTPSSSSKSSTTKVAQVRKIDAEGIAEGVRGGSANNKTGGARGKALTSDQDDVLAAYYSMFKQRLRAEFLPPPGVSDSLKVTIEVLSHADGDLSNPRVVKSSGSDEFDRAVIEAVRRVRMPARPDKKSSELVDLIFTMRERNEG